MQREKLELLVSERSNPCVTISMNTHRTHSDSSKDVAVLNDLLKEAREQVMNGYDQGSVSDLLAKIGNIGEEIDVNNNLDSLHIFLSNSTCEIVKAPWSTPHDRAYVSEGFWVKPLIKVFNRSEEYLILLISQTGAKLLHAVNDAILDEIKNDDFPNTENPHSNDNLYASDSKAADNLVREYLNKLDKAVVRVFNQTNLKCVAVCTEDTNSRLMQMADKPYIYLGHTTIDYNKQAFHQISSKVWEIVKGQRVIREQEALDEMQEAAGHSKVITKLADIFKAVKEGRGDLLIVHDDFHQAVKMTGEFTFKLVEDDNLPDVIDDISSEIAWEVISKKGRAIYTNMEEMKTLGNIALKVRY
ncbi:MAG: hypothetical protein GZ094_15505 [Mariniphaga sp.]|nr:hypothetical protein [Mariniphaga sp.]